MATIKTYPMPNSTILRINSEKEFINTNPEYQRNGEVWTREKKQLLIDSILNDYDIPKLYFHLLPKNAGEENYDYSIIDGRQRIEAVWGFMDGAFPLSNDFILLSDETLEARGLTYSDLAKEFPRLRVRFDSYVLPIVLVETSDIELIEDMFSRLNEAVPLNAAEKRNALGGPMATAIRKLAEEPFFKELVKFSNKRYQHREVATRFLFIEYSYHSGRLLDTKKPYLDKMVSNFKGQNFEEVEPYFNASLQVVRAMSDIFSIADVLLRSQSVVTIYYLVVKLAIENNEINLVTRQRLLQFFGVLSDNKRAAEQDITNANYDYLEFDRLSQQGTNDAYSIRERTRILCEFLGVAYRSDLERN
ncbi:DUF262 domain-containing protein [Dyadobacter bucti]|uniref:DUF262 domain-containing protein n=1 Tax=Dyadobacter bucti TaxID=2572203 RepID=UPI001107C2BC|nr:DUF262 domain-containing protein [Dyadobacter bucti]